MMTRLFTILFLFLFSVASLSAQDCGGRWSITPRLGVNNSDVMGLHWYTTTGSVTNTAQLAETTSKWGLTVGADVEYRLSRRIGFSFGWFYSNEGYSMKGKDDGSVYVGGKTVGSGDKVKTHLHNFCFPLLVNVYVLRGLAVKAGLQVNGLVSSRQKFEGNSTELPLNSLHTVGLGLPVGVSYELKNIVLDVRYVWTFTNHCDLQVSNNMREVWNSRSLWMTLGYRFRL